MEKHRLRIMHPTLIYSDADGLTIETKDYVYCLLHAQLASDPTFGHGELPNTFFVELAIKDPE